MDLSKSLHGFVKIVTSNSRPFPKPNRAEAEFGQDFSRLLHGFITVLTRTCQHCYMYFIFLPSAKPILEAEV